MTAWALFWMFAKISVLTFGGGYAMIPLFQDELVNRTQLINADEFANLIALAQMTPGPVGLNSATYIGYQQAGFAGAVAGTLGAIMPSIILVIAAVFFLNQFKESRLLKSVLTGVRPATLGLIFAAVLFFADTSVFTVPLKSLWVDMGEPFAISLPGLAIFTGVLVSGLYYRLNIIWVLVASGLAGYLLLL